jgi:hypothetical protein
MKFILLVSHHHHHKEELTSGFTVTLKFEKVSLLFLAEEILLRNVWRRWLLLLLQ